LAHRALVRLPVHFIQREAVHAFIDTVRDHELKKHILMGGNRSLNETFNQALKLEAVNAAATTPVKLTTR
jgi:hypothetical protein